MCYKKGYNGVCAVSGKLLLYCCECNYIIAVQ